MKKKLIYSAKDCRLDRSSRHEGPTICPGYQIPMSGPIVFVVPWIHRPVMPDPKDVTKLMAERVFPRVSLASLTHDPNRGWPALVGPEECNPATSLAKLEKIYFKVGILLYKINY